MPKEGANPVAVGISKATRNPSLLQLHTLAATAAAAAAAAAWWRAARLQRAPPSCSSSSPLLRFRPEAECVGASAGTCTTGSRKLCQCSMLPNQRIRLGSPIILEWSWRPNRGDVPGGHRDPATRTSPARMVWSRPRVDHVG